MRGDSWGWPGAGPPDLSPTGAPREEEPMRGDSWGW